MICLPIIHSYGSFYPDVFVKLSKVMPCTISARAITTNNTQDSADLFAIYTTYRANPVVSFQYLPSQICPFIFLSIFIHAFLAAPRSSSGRNGTAAPSAFSWLPVHHFSVFCCIHILGVRLVLAGPTITRQCGLSPPAAYHFIFSATILGLHHNRCH